MAGFPPLKRAARRHGVVVITGASSGIGRATARAFARRGASLVLAGRNGGNLETAARECRRLGGRVLTVPTDVSDEGQILALAQAAVAAFGRIDVWVGNASVYSYGTFEQTPPEVFRQLVETNLFGQVYGARAVLPIFRQQGGGTLIFIGSIYSKITTPYVSPYVTSKFGLLGLAETLQQEYLRERGIDICVILPATIDTPIYQHAANYTGQRVHPLPPVVSPRRVARTIVRRVRRPRAVTPVGRLQGAFLPAHAALPGLFRRGSVPLMDAVALRGGNVPPHDGTVFVPAPAGGNNVTGGWRSPVRRAALAGALVLAARGLTKR